MSHFTTIQTQVRDIAALRDACQELGLQVVEKADARGCPGSRRPWRPSFDGMEAKAPALRASTERVLLP